MISLGLFGSEGRMGQTVRALVEEATDIEICALADRNFPLDSEAFKKADVILDFSTSDATKELVYLVSSTNAALVTGVTARDETQQSAIRLLSATRPVFAATNFSLGIAVLTRLSEIASEVLGSDFDIEISETHHRKKRDAPSGTAVTLAERLAAVRGFRKSEPRFGLGGERARDEIAISSLRGGDVVGDHTVHFFGPGERLELTHRASDRSLFAHGALRAVRFVAGRAPGFYSMPDLLSELGF